MLSRRIPTSASQSSLENYEYIKSFNFIEIDEKSMVSVLMSEGDSS